MVMIENDKWAKDNLYSQTERQDRTFSFIRIHESNGLPELKDLGAELARKHNLPTNNILALPGWPDPYQFLWLNGIVAEFDKPILFPNQKSFTKHVRKILAEMFDIDILASIYGYGLSLFCSNDKSQEGGSKGHSPP